MASDLGRARLAADAEPVHAMKEARGSEGYIVTQCDEVLFHESKERLTVASIWSCRVDCLACLARPGWLV